MRAEGLNLHSRLCEHLALIYPASRHELLAGQLLEAMQLPLDCPSPQGRRNLWDQRDSVLITYGNSIVNTGQRPLQTLHDFLRAELTEVFSAVHILPFFPHSSDDGFAVMDYLTVNPALGEWEDISAIAADYQLMADLVINHASSRSRWFDNFKKRVDYTESGGVPLLGVKGAGVICHGRSNANAIKNAIRVAADFSSRGINEKIERDLAQVAEK